MATRLYRDREYGFKALDLNSIPSTPTLGVKFHSYGSGYKASKSERKAGIQLPYFARNASGWVDKPFAAVPATSIYAPTPAHGSYWGGGTGSSFSVCSKAVNQSWEKFIDRARGDSADLGVMLGEGKEAFNMVADRMISLRKSYKALRRGDFRRFLRELSTDPKRKHRSKTRSTAAEASGLWLEYWFGWSPFVSGIYSGLEVVTGPGTNGRRRVYGVSRQNLPDDTKTAGSGDGYYRRRVTTTRAVGFVKQGATVWVSSENLLLLNRLGLVNPAAVAWELVPFSFVVDWFTRAGDVINGWTDLVGVGNSHQFSTCHIRSVMHGTYGKFNPPLTANTCEVSWRTGHTERRDRLSKPVATFPSLLNYGNSRTRAATAASLLTQIFLAK